MEETNDSYNKLLNRISNASGLSLDEVKRKIEAKIAKLSGLISREGAAQIVSAELGVNLDEEKLKINELVPGMRKANVVGKVIRLFPVRTFERQGKENKVANFIIADDTSNIKVVLWDTHHIELIENGTIAEGKVVEILSGSVRDNEIHLGSFSELKISEEVFENVVEEIVSKEKKIADFRVNENVSVRAFVVQIFEPRFFYVCPECRKKVNEAEMVCPEHGKVPAEKRALVNIVLDDGSGSIRAVLFHEQVQELGLNELNNPERLSFQKQDALGKEMIFTGVVRLNKFFNNNEFIVSKVQPVDLDELIEKLENKN